MWVSVMGRQCHNCRQKLDVAVVTDLFSGRTATITNLLVQQQPVDSLWFGMQQVSLFRRVGCRVEQLHGRQALFFASRSRGALQLPRQVSSHSNRHSCMISLDIAMPHCQQTVTGCNRVSGGCPPWAEPSEVRLYCAELDLERGCECTVLPIIGLFNGKLPDELLNREIFDTLRKVHIPLECWRVDYKTVRPAQFTSPGYCAASASQP